MSGLPWPSPLSLSVLLTSYSHHRVQVNVSPIRSLYCLASSPCTWLSHAPSTTGESDYRYSFRIPMDSPFRLRTLFYKDRSGSPKSFAVSFSVRTMLSDPAGVSSHLALTVAYFCLPGFRPCRPPVVFTRLNRFTCITVQTDLCLRLACVVTFTDPRLDSRWSGFAPCRCGSFTRWIRPVYLGAPKNFSKSMSTTQRRPSLTYLRAASTACCALRLGR